MYDNPDSNDSSIQIKTSLRQTIEKLKRSINLIDLIDEEQTVDVNIITTLTDNSNSLLKYLQENKLSQTEQTDEDNLPENASEKDIQTLKNQKKSSQSKVDYSANYSNNTSYYQSQKQQSNNQFNLIIIITLVISLCFNIYSFFWKPTTLTKVELNDNQKEQLINTVETKTPESKTDKFDLDKSSEESERIETTIIEQNNIPKIDTKEELKISPETFPDNEIKIIKPEPETIVEPEDINYEVKEKLPESIANQFLQIANDYAENLIYLIIPYYKSNSMTIVVNNNWQEIESKKQEELSAKMLKKAKSIDFYRFQIKDRKGKLLARNPAIGDQIILLK